jgi:hypothetical protein
MKILVCSLRTWTANAEWLEMVIARVEHRGGDCQMKFASGQRWVIVHAFVIVYTFIRSDKPGCD